ncbi:helix-turn-helix domain-containing protein [Thalassomonas haliotis]|uniref:Helix-turn-helix transcriptional regulator n=1 Tax=Thalassomonas haliotis TaxID=485448 RepID=A0ABY7VL00_9GAMM|nr:helix-turn-helix transcriptional regulator [Thalassomonas haliotis]WDE14166.1 helix-turn-helix transcriptional regulator [Thalassomonas haliotis]
MILKELRISRQLSQEQLAQMSGLNVRTIQRIESGKNASTESLKCLASALSVDVSTLKQDKFFPDKSSDNWKSLSLLLKIWFMLNFLQIRSKRATAVRVEVISHVSGFIFCCLGLINEAALAGGLIMLATGYLFHLLKWQGDKYGIWFEHQTIKGS